MAPRTVRVLLAVIALLLVAPIPAARAADADFSFPNGWFYTQAGGAPGVGFAITNDGGVELWRDYQRLGGPATLGYPSSWRFVGADGFIYQATQGALLQWLPDENRTVLANSFDLLSAAYKDEWLKARSVPTPVADDGSRGDPLKAYQTRIGWLDDDAIRGAYMANPNPAAIGDWSVQRAVELYGLPVSHPLRQGPFVVQRFQRVAFQHWVDPIPGLPAPGSVTRVLAGDLLKDAGLLPPASTVPLEPGSALARVEPDLRWALDLLASTPAGKPLAELARARALALVWAPMDGKTLGFSSASRGGWVAINLRLRAEDPRIVATVLGHELSHVRDYLSLKPVWSNAGCLESEQTAYRTQAEIWQAFYGAGGKTGDVTEMDREQNFVLTSIERDPAGFANLLRQTYDGGCALVR